MSEPAQSAKTIPDPIGYAPDEPIFDGSPVGIQLHTDFGNYELLEELGRGAMGVVYKARQRDLDRLVAIKVILAGRLATPQQVQRFRDEARAAAKLQHANVVRVYDAGEVRGNHFFAMEYIVGRSLADVMQTRRLTFEEIAELISAVARAIDHLHSQGILHRDLKPSNIIIDEQERPFVTDFGLAMLLDRNDKSGMPLTVAGTPNYMAPEQAAGTLVSPRTDVFGLGAVLYHLMANRPPFEAASTVDTLVQVMEGEPPRPRQLNAQIPAELETICLRCLEKRPEQRYASAAALADDLDRFLRGEAVESRPLGLVHQLQSWARRQPALVARLSGLAACAVIAQINYHVFHDELLPQQKNVLITLAVWGVVSIFCQWLLEKERWNHYARLMWAAADVLLMTTLIRILGAANSALVAGYALAITGAGLWLREQIVWLVTLTSVVGYAVLVADGYLHYQVMPPPHWHFVFLTLLVVLGWVVAYQVRRIRKLSRHYRH
ncbi:MAG TPA: serine/threonine-protein kinase [Verrucomicrobiae bacterium]|nr:serine/threonine-protein kinase [Verrucomicrobiae bacterium]